MWKTKSRAHGTHEAHEKTALFRRTDFCHLDELARVGLKQRLPDFYRQMDQDDPATCVPEAALRLLQ